jgi:hypothetical protein
MLKLVRSSYARGFYAQALFVAIVLLFAGPIAHAQITFLDRQLSRIDVAGSGYASITKSVAGTNYLGEAVSDDAATTLGALVQVRYTKNPLVGFEFNYTYARFTQNFSIAPFGVQSNSSEYTLGYVVHLPDLLGVKPFASVGAGTTAFKPTPLGGQGLPEIGRLTGYYDIGVDDQFLPHIGFRAQFRQAFYKAPDFNANYLTIDQRTFTSEPSAGVYFKF